jgi:hypothetical protein
LDASRSEQAPIVGAGAGEDVPGERIGAEREVARDRLTAADRVREVVDPRARRGAETGKPWSLATSHPKRT